MRCKLLLVLALITLLILSSCAEKECKTIEDCTAKPKSAFTLKCVDYKCQYTPIPNTCGNEECDAGENKCTCSEDCGTCKGNVPNTQFLTQECVNNQCVETVKSQKPIFSTNELLNAGDRFNVDILYNTPFNIKQDTYKFTITLRQLGLSNKDHNILRAQLTGRTKDRRTITLGTKEINKPLWGEGSSIEETMILDFPTVEKESELSSLVLSIDYEYAVVQGGQRTSRQATLRQTFQDKFPFVNPTGPGICPEVCDDNNPGTEDKCGAETGYFCIHEPIINTCGNFRCDVGETKCTCEKDCGPCKGSAGTYLDYTCKQKTCVTVMKPEVTVQVNKIPDERSFGPVALSNKYEYPNPFDVTKDRMSLQFSIYNKDPTVSDVTIEKIRLIEGQQEIVELPVNRKLGDTPTTFNAQVPQLSTPEEERRVTLIVWYAYTKDGTVKRGDYQKQLSQIAFIQPG